VKEVEKIFSSLKDHKPFSLGVDMGADDIPSVDVKWRISIHRFNHQLSTIEFRLNVLISHQLPNVTETRFSFHGCNLSRIPTELWRLLSKFNNLTYLNIGFNTLRVVSPLVCDLIHLQELHLEAISISAEGVVGVCELLKVCCSIAHVFVGCGG